MSKYMMKGMIIVALPLIVASSLEASFAQSAKMVLQDFNKIASPPKNIGGTGYPMEYTNAGLKVGGNTIISIDSKNKALGTGNGLKLSLTEGFSLYTQWNPYDGSGRGFTRDYLENPAGWQFNTYNRFRFWFFPASNGSVEQFNGTNNYYLGTYVKRVTNAARYSDEEGGNHYYHSFNLLRNQWALCVFNSHPSHRRGNSGGTDPGNLPYPTTPEYGGSGDPSRTYNYFDTLTRFYIQEVNKLTNVFPRDYWIDEIEFYQEPNPENDEQVYSICASYNRTDNRIFLSWSRLKDENSIKHEVRYSFSEIYDNTRPDKGWSNATPAPNGLIKPPGWQGYNGMVYDTSAIPIDTNKSMIYLIIKPENSNLFSQIRLPLNFAPNTSGTLTAPSNLTVK